MSGQQKELGKKWAWMKFVNILESDPNEQHSTTSVVKVR